MLIYHTISAFLTQGLFLLYNQNMSIFKHISQIFTQNKEVESVNLGFDPVTYIFVGLGNPGPKYSHTRHNIGRMAVLQLAENYQTEFIFDKKFQAQIGNLKIDNKSVVLLLPENFMNNSGVSLKSYLNFFKGDYKIVIVHDDLDLPLGKIKLVASTATGGGHNGVKSILENVKGENIMRLKLGISPEGLNDDNLKNMRAHRTADFVVGAFTDSEKDLVAESVASGAEILQSVVTDNK